MTEKGRMNGSGKATPRAISQLERLMKTWRGSKMLFLIPSGNWCGLRISFLKLIISGGLLPMAISSQLTTWLREFSIWLIGVLYVSRRKNR